MWINNKENVDEKTDNKLIELTRDISKRLKAEVFIEEGEEIIGYTKTLLDLPSLALKMKKEQSSLKVAFNGFPEQSKAVKNISVDDLKDVPERLNEKSVQAIC